MTEACVRSPEVWRHVKTGGLYTVLMHATLESNLQDVVVYSSCQEGRVWVRPAVEFYDGRFEKEDATRPHG